ncbi:MAG: radical SAM protein, partial [Candidatus Saganbacteria bacterium]|nr:radical SAM protein [Candidatus Saganbacteria bacterium]
LCNVCYSEIPAYVYEEDGRVFISKKCLEHGEFRGLIEKDTEYYKRFAHTKPQKTFFNTLVIPITYRCNLNCKYCYAPHTDREDMPFNDIERAIARFPGKEIAISGGEPTLRDDLERIITLAKGARKKTFLLTNGLKLADPAYVKRLKKAGLDRIFFSFDSFSEDFYNMFKGSKSNSIDLLDQKKKALGNIEKESIKTLLSATIYPNFNDKEMKDIFLFALERSHFIEMLRIRSCARIGRNSMSNENGFFGSELLDLLSKAVNIDKRTLLTKNLVPDDHSPYHVLLSFKGLIEGREFIAEPKLSFQNLGQKILTSVFKPASVKKLQVRIISWPTVESIDLLELEKGVGHITNENKVINFCLAINLDNLYG